MNFVKFESATEKERIRSELRNAREELLARAKKQAETRAANETARKLKGEETWIHPSVNNKIEKLIKEHKVKPKKKNKDKKKNKRKNKDEKKKKKKRSRSSSSSDSSSSTEEEILKKKKKKKRESSESDNNSSSSLESEEEEEWVEKKMQTAELPPKNLIRDDWMNDGSLFLKTYSKDDKLEDKKEKNKSNTYDPTKSVRELNPYWKDGGKGIPTFQKPKEDDSGNSGGGDYKKRTYPYRKPYSGNWKKDDKSNNNRSVNSREDARRNARFEKDDYKSKHDRECESDCRRSQSKYSPGSQNIKGQFKNDKGFLVDQEMNELGAKLINAEIMGNTSLAAELQEKLNTARNIRNEIKEMPKSSTSMPKKRDKSPKDEHILLTTTNSRGMTKPLSSIHPLKANDLYGGRKSNKRQKTETHVAGERVRYFPDDDRYDIKQMFEREKYTTATDSDAQFIEIAGKHKNSKDDLEDIFADKVRNSISDYDREEKEKKRAIAEHERFTKVLESCDKCFESPKMEKSYMVAMGSTSYLSIPYHEGLQPGHCFIVPMQHTSCSTQLDEDTWNEITDFRKALTQMYASKSQEVIFFEIANYLHKRPHMVIHCVPIGDFEMAPMYFKKAIQESEYEWSTNKQLVTLKEKDLRRSIPKGLPYFWVHFGMDLGFAHVIEDQHKFKPNFAQEIIGGMLQLDPRTWRKPRKEHNFINKVKQLADLWQPFDFTSNN